MTDASRFVWADGDGDLLSAACFTAVVGVEADEVARRFGGDLATERAATFEAAFNPYPEKQFLVFDDVAGAVLAAENNGWEGSRSEVASEVSRGAAFASVYWSVNADMRFVHAVDGQIVTAFDPLLDELPWEGSDPGALSPLLGGLRFGVGAPRATSLALIERLTGVALEPEWLATAHRCVELTPLPERA